MGSPRVVVGCCACACVGYLAACGTDSPTPAPPPAPARVASVAVTPATAKLYPGGSAQLAAAPLDSAGHALSGRVVTWSSADTLVATVSATGLVRGVAPGGPVTVTATSEGQSGAAAVTVIAVPVASVTVTPGRDTLLVGLTLQLAAATFDSAGGALAGRTVSWASSDSAVASVSSKGLVRAVAPGGPVTITATSEGRTGSATVVVTAGMVTAIARIADFLERCPGSDTAMARIRADFEVRVDGQLVSSAIPCTEPISTLPIAQYTDELIALQVFRTVYYMSPGTAGKLPWTPLGLYDWMRSRIAGVNIKKAAGQLYCCDAIGGKLYFSSSRQDTFNRDFKRRWPGIAIAIDYYAHEIRHADPGAPGHTTGCAAFPQPTDPPGCDATYDPANLGSYGVQYWLESRWATGYLNIGIACAPADTARAYAQWNQESANGFRTRFVTNVPPVITAAPPYGGPCVAR